MKSSTKIVQKIIFNWNMELERHFFRLFNGRLNSIRFIEILNNKLLQQKQRGAYFNNAPCFRAKWRNGFKG